MGIKNVFFTGRVNLRPVFSSNYIYLKGFREIICQGTCIIIAHRTEYKPKYYCVMKINLTDKVVQVVCGEVLSIGA